MTKIDLRTRRGREQEVLDEVRQYGRLTVFWITENQKRAWAVCRLERSGAIVRMRRSPRDRYPFCCYRLGR